MKYECPECGRSCVSYNYDIDDESICYTFNCWVDDDGCGAEFTVTFEPGAVETTKNPTEPILKRMGKS